MHLSTIRIRKPVVISRERSAASSWCGDRKLNLNGSTVFLTESVFKACALHRLGLNAWSVLGSNVSEYLYHQLRLLGLRFVCLGDNDKAGQEFSQTFGLGAVSNDLDEMPDEQLLDLTLPFLRK
ncbi:hypothetical protein pEaSNUABM35_00022 [Erwinia phage pEa_SNUABM_35]|uniref:DNA primase n=1 Tax=Erwinia phage pEa_SNUABM_35 TaxID=2869557 RepID=A0AAE7XNZ4_9CAUD|nr:DNA primase [Erwinia phage pEa_SNUABM_35]QZE59939.1 hypothetical protein pEaSNUABM35_00022 [Erwinia phage pEa_SNUABM_35]QZE60275.1 hypothetical protein pEaSNUABM36_00022 [Erwinia phage pEa_SNUABM_36]